PPLAKHCGASFPAGLTSIFDALPGPRRPARFRAGSGQRDRNEIHIPRIRSIGRAVGTCPRQYRIRPKRGGDFTNLYRDSPASMSIHEEGTVGVIMPMMGVFNNLVLFDQHVPQNSLRSVVPELATSWVWSEEGTELTFKLRDGVK